MLDNLEQLLPDVELVADSWRRRPGCWCLRRAALPSPRRRARVPGSSSRASGDGAGRLRGARGQRGRCALRRASTRGRSRLRADDGTRAVGDVCGRLDGLPLAIELAVRARSSSAPSTIGGALDQALDFSRRRADLPDRQRTSLDARVESRPAGSETPQSSPASRPSQAAGRSPLRKPCARTTGFPSSSRWPRWSTGTSVRRLERPGPEPRFAMLETIREYSAESLLRSGEAKAMKQRHAEHMLAIAEEANAVISPAAAQTSTTRDSTRSRTTSVPRSRGP